LGSAAAVVNLVPGILESASRAKKIEVKTWRKKEKNKLVVKNDRNNSDTALDFSNRGGGESLHELRITTKSECWLELERLCEMLSRSQSKKIRAGSGAEALFAINSNKILEIQKNYDIQRGITMIEDMKIFHKTYEFIKWVHTLLNKFPKSEKYTMAQKIENTALNFLESIIQSNNDFDKKESLQKAIIELDKLRIFFRLSKDLQFISFAQYEYGSNLINEIGRMLGGWYKKYTNIPS